MNKTQNFLPYVEQTKDHGYSCCYIIMCLNVLRYFGIPTIEPNNNDPKWERIVDRYCCRDGAALYRDELLNEMKLISERLDNKDGRFNIEWRWENHQEDVGNSKDIPFSISHFSSIGYHSSLVVDVENHHWIIVNYEGYKGPNIQKIQRSKINIHFGISGGIHRMRLKD